GEDVHGEARRPGAAGVGAEAAGRSRFGPHACPGAGAAQVRRGLHRRGGRRGGGRQPRHRRTLAQAVLHRRRARRGPSRPPAAAASGEAQDRRGGRGAAGHAGLLHAAGRARELDHAVAGRLVGEAEVRRRARLRRDGAARAQKNEIKPWL
ncbi:MAG: hypothetical protein AVDCRST_MAG08-950, partial [uncultured Acetobacteraceae bacterium]